MLNLQTFGLEFGLYHRFRLLYDKVELSAHQHMVVILKRSVSAPGISAKEVAFEDDSRHRL